MFWQPAIGAFLLGLVGSLHCVGMCGPLALALPVHHLSKARQIIAILLYNTGRIITYSCMGALLGVIGKGIFLAGMQQWFSILLGLALLLSLLWQRLPTHKAAPPAGIQQLYIKMQQLTARLLQPHSLAGYLLPGLANGLLPCGMVYLALAGALATRHISHAVSIMFFFGTGTLPAMLALGLFGLYIGMPLRKQFKKAMPWLTGILALVLILRGLNAGIPFISPQLAAGSGEIIPCHK
jgi:sulfite exporter TauE/SafE